MEELRRQVRQARWWLGAQRFVGLVGWCWFAALLVAFAGILVDKFWPLGIEAWAWGVGALGGGLLAALAWTVIRRHSTLEAAIELDRRFGLRERVSSTLALSPEERETEIGQALIADAVRRVERIDVRERFRVSLGRQMLLPLVPGLLAVLVAILVQPAVVDNPADASTDPAAVKKQIEQSGQSLRRKLEEQRKRAQQKGLKDAQQLLHRLEDETKDLGTKEGDRKQAMIKLNDLAQQLEKRQKQLGGAERIQKQLNQMKDLGKGPADKFLNALAQGDMKKALNELEKLKGDLANDRLNPQEREELAKQLDQMREKLQNMVDAQRKAEEDLQKRIDQARRAGQKEEAEKLQDKLDQLRQQAPQMNRLQQLADKLGRCAQCARDGKKAAEAGEMLGELEKDLKGLQQQLQEFEMLDDAKNQLDQARAQMECKQCGGTGCNACQIPGDGLGAGRGFGERPEAKDDVDFYDTRAVVKVGRGKATMAGEVDGPNVKGNFQQKLNEQFQSARQESADPLTNERIPRKQRQHAQEYFDHLREGR